MSEELLENRNFDKRFKLHKATAKEELRPALDLIKFAEGYAYASNGMLAVKAKLKTISNFTDAELANLDGKSIDSDSFRKILTFEHATIEENCITATNNQGDKTSFYFNAQEELKIKIENVFSNLLPHYREDIKLFSFTVSELKKLPEILGTKNLVFKAYTNTRFLVTGDMLPGADLECLFMGRHIEEDEEE